MISSIKNENHRTRNCMCHSTYEHSSLPRFQSTIKTIGYAIIKPTVTILMKDSMICTKTYPKLWGNEPQRQKILKTYHFSNIRALLHIYQDFKAKKKTKTIGQATKFDTVVIPCNSNISHFLTCLKGWEEWAKPITYLKMIIFHDLEHCSMPYKVAKQNKSNCARNCIWHSYHFMQI